MSDDETDAEKLNKQLTRTLTKAFEQVKVAKVPAPVPYTGFDGTVHIDIFF